MWKHFHEQCAFCGKKLKREDRKGHADHLVPAAEGGHNHIFNRVLACASCNGDEKLDHHWLQFLGQVKNATEDFQTRKKRIENWQALHKAECSVEKSDLAKALLAAEEAIRAFNKACDRVRAMRSNRQGQVLNRRPD